MVFPTFKMLIAVKEHSAQVHGKLKENQQNEVSMAVRTAAAIAHPNIAFIKYWGNKDDLLRLPMNGSISMNLGTLYTKTVVSFRDELHCDTLKINDKEINGEALTRVAKFLDIIRSMSAEPRFATVESVNNFPIGAGIASSASAFAALALAGSAAAGMELSEAECSRLARRGSGSACRSVPGGYSEWLAGDDDQSSLSISIAAEDYWDLIDLIVVVSESHKKVGSTAGHRMAVTSPYQQMRVESAPERLLECRNAILQRDFNRLAEVSEKDSTMMHAVMMTQNPPLFYWEPLSLDIIKTIMDWRKDGFPCFATLDAGPNVHIICPASVSAALQQRLDKIPGVKEIIRSNIGGAAVLV